MYNKLHNVISPNIGEIPRYSKLIN